MFLFRSPAKLNLFFRVLYKRSDGYHEIASIYQAIDCFDQIRMELSDQDRFFSNQPQLIFPDNLVLKALRLFRKKTGISQKVTIYLEKKIPIGGGLGGGSSNAATTLWGLNKIFQTNISKNKLMEMSELLGSDVPFFFSTGSSLCTGKGEKITPLKLPEYQGWIMCPDVIMSTPEVYKRVCLNKVSSISIPTLVKSFKEKAPIFVNDLEHAAFSIEPKLREIKTCSKAVLTGSGACFFSLTNPEPLRTKSFLFRSIFRDLDGWF